MRTRRGLGLAAALVIAVVAIGAQHWRLQDPHIVYDRFRLPAFDAHVYVGMAERPMGFSVAPWGYRLLMPILADAVPYSGVARGFMAVTLVALVLATVLLYLFLRRLGHGRAASLAACAAFGLSPPVALAIRYPFLTEPLAILFLVLFLLLAEAGVSLSALALVGVLGAMTKEILLWPLPLLILVAWRQRPGWSAVGRGALAAAPALVSTFLLRQWWQGAPDEPGSGGWILGAVPAAVELVLAAWSEWWKPLLLVGIVPLALLGALRRCARPFLKRYGWLMLAYLALPFAAGVYVVEAALPTEFFSGDVARLILYVLPFALPLALLAVDRVVPHWSPPAPLSPWPMPLQWGLAIAACGLALAPLITLDSYRRIDLSREREGPYVLATLRETWRTAERLENGARIAFSPEANRWVPRRSDAPLMYQMRWFLFDGWGRKAYYGSRDIVMRQRSASLLLPVLRPRTLRIDLSLVATEPEPLEILVNGRSLLATLVGVAPSTLSLEVPGDLLFRGDNLITLRRARDGVHGPRLLEYAIQAH